MPDLYPIIEVRREWARESEEMGSKDKFWYLHPKKEKEYWLFKYPRPNTGEHWAEKVAAEVAALLEIPHARVKLAVFENDKGSVTKSFAQEGQTLVHGNQVLALALRDYDPKQKFHQSSHTLANIWQVMDRVFVKPENAHKAKSNLADFLILDAVIGNVDRHHENWGVLLRWNRTEDDQDVDLSVTPSFDHASSLGREFEDTKRDRLLAEIGIGAYVEKGRGAIFWSEDDRHGPSPLELVRRATSEYPEHFRPALKKLENLDKKYLDDLVHRVPGDWMSPSARKFAIALMRYNLEQLQELF